MKSLKEKRQRKTLLLNPHITQPQLIKQCNNGMGVDVKDWLLGSYRPVIPGKKWYWLLIIYAIDVSVVADWQLHCVVAETPKSHLEFWHEIAICPLKSPTDVRKKTTGGAIANLPSDLRYDSADHFKISTTQGRCKYNTRSMQNIPQEYSLNVKNATYVFTQIKVRCVLRCIIHTYKSDSIQKTFISLYVWDFSKG